MNKEQNTENKDLTANFGNNVLGAVREFEIWMEGYAATGEHGTAQMIGKGFGSTFDEAVKDYMSKNQMLAEVAVYNEDCRQTMERLQSNSLDLIVTSPPYFNARDYSQYNSVQDYMAQMKEVFTMAYDKLKESRMCVINVSPVLVEREKRSKQSYRIPLPFYFVPMMEEIGFEFLEDIIWMKPDGSAPNRNGGFYRHRKPVAYKPNIVTEYVLVFKKPAPFLIDKVLKTHSLVEGEYERTNVWRINPDTNNWHPAPFPEALAERIIRYYSYEGEVIYDCFAGSGTVGKVGSRLNRKVILSELKQEYYAKMVELNGW